MRVLIVSQYFWPEGFRINDLVKTLAEKGVEIDVLTGKPNYPEGSIYPGYRALGCQIEHWSGATLYRVPLMPRGGKSEARLTLNYLSFVISALFFGPWLLRRQRYDAIFVYGLSPILQAIPALFLGWLKRSPVIIWVQDLWPESLEATGYVRNRHLLAQVAKVVSFIYRHTDLLLVQSRAFIPFVAALAPGKSILYYPNSVDVSFSLSEIVALPEIPGLDQGFSIVFAGNIGAGQAVEVIVEAAALLQGYEAIRFVVVGQGSRWEWMREQVALRGLTNVYLPGRYPVAAMPGLMQKAGALLVSLADQPIFAATVPNKVQAYMASGRPILASLNGEGARLVVEADAGLATPAGNAKALAEAVLKLFQMTPAERERLGANGRRYFKAHFDHDMLTDQLIGHFRAVTELHNRED
ncbi:MAG: glycosyltransferase family 4 protein [Betaproteobacteria bacterium]